MTKSKKKFSKRKCACGKTFEPNREWQRFCSSRCRYKYWTKSRRDTKENG